MSALQLYGFGHTEWTADAFQGRHRLVRTLGLLSLISVGRLIDLLCSTEDIHTIVLDNLIQSTLAMNNTQMKSSRSFQVSTPLIFIHEPDAADKRPPVTFSPVPDLPVVQ